MKNIQILIVALSMPILSFSQITKERDVIGAAGIHSVTANLQVSWTVGEIAVTDFQSANLIVSQGFQQSDYGVVELDDLSMSTEIEVYPNPVSDFLHFNVTSSENIELAGGLYDLNGKRIIDISAFEANPGYQGLLDCDKLSAGTWILKFNNQDGTILKTYRILKSRIILF